MASDTKFVKFAVLGGRVQEIALANGANIGEGLEVAGLSDSGYQIKKNGSSATREDGLRNGDVVLLVPAVKGGR